MFPHVCVLMWSHRTPSFLHPPPVSLYPSGHTHGCHGDGDNRRAMMTLPDWQCDSRGNKFSLRPLPLETAVNGSTQSVIAAMARSSAVRGKTAACVCHREIWFIPFFFFFLLFLSQRTVKTHKQTRALCNTDSCKRAEGNHMSGSQAERRQDNLEGSLQASGQCRRQINGKRKHVAFSEFVFFSFESCTRM